MLTRLLESQPHIFEDVHIYPPPMFSPMIDPKHFSAEEALQTEHSWAVHRWAHTWSDCAGYCKDLSLNGTSETYSSTSSSPAQTHDPYSAVLTFLLYLLYFLFFVLFLLFLLIMKRTLSSDSPGTLIF